jgi:hypothetical protein
VNSSLYTAERHTHLKVVAVAVFGATVIALIAILAHMPGSAPTIPRTVIWRSLP